MSKNKIKENLFALTAFSGKSYARKKIRLACPSVFNRDWFLILQLPSRLALP